MPSAVDVLIFSVVALVFLSLNCFTEKLVVSSLKHSLVTVVLHVYFVVLTTDAFTTKCVS